jgi:hypothetical protein
VRTEATLAVAESARELAARNPGLFVCASSINRWIKSVVITTPLVEVVAGVWPITPVQAMAANKIDIIAFGFTNLVDVFFHRLSLVLDRKIQRQFTGTKFRGENRKNRSAPTQGTLRAWKGENQMIQTQCRAQSEALVTVNGPSLEEGGKGSF